MNVLVTGCSRGVGLEICRVLLEQGNTVYGVARSYTDEFKALEAEYAGKLLIEDTNVSRIKEELSEKVKEKVIIISAKDLVNNSRLKSRACKSKQLALEMDY